MLLELLLAFAITGVIAAAGAAAGVIAWMIDTLLSGETYR